MAEQFPWVLLPQCSLPERPFPIKSLVLSVHVSSQTINFCDKSPLLGPRRGPPSSNRRCIETPWIIFSNFMHILSFFFLIIKKCFIEYLACAMVLLLWLSGKESASNAGDKGPVSGWGRSPGGGHGNPLRYSCLENPMNKGAQQATVHSITESDMTEVTEKA